MSHHITALCSSRFNLQEQVEEEPAESRWPHHTRSIVIPVRTVLFCVFCMQCAWLVIPKSKDVLFCLRRHIMLVY